MRDKKLGKSGSKGGVMEVTMGTEGKSEIPIRGGKRKKNLWGKRVSGVRL